METKTAALLTIKSPGKMDKKGRKRIAKWLMSRAKHFENHGDLYTMGKYIQRYLYL